MKLTRRSLIAGIGAAAIPMTSVFAQKADFVLKFANNQPMTHPINIRGKEMVDAIRTETKGRVDVQVYSSGQLGSDTDMLSQLRSGGIDFFTLSSLILSTLVPATALTGVGFAFPDYDAVWRALDGELGAYIRSQIGKTSIVAMDKIWDNGFRQITSSVKPINSVDDLKNMKIRVPPSQLATAVFKAFDANPTAINFAEVYSALQTKIVDGQENPLAIISAAKLNEVQKYCSLTNHQWDGLWFLANKKSLERLPEDLRAIVIKNINAAGVRERVDVANQNANLQKDLTDKGMVFNQPKVDSFRDRLRKSGFYSEWKEKFGAEGWGALESAVGKLA